ncbi:hydrogenase formation protein HypD [Lamprobacter modestohalophilus]|uniref:hydrogenase formation protein HypD n=1 Tax=Lamprobacter modestohalophilus TaxID=1064514 RepID=UPI002ADEC65A|nr:hydrogenase formation protein HypD [Lamprobacter modestohalophilus]MEA1048603.1 hydrogenase formation protein HypD [Lamprobacter modestohalophilus]
MKYIDEFRDGELARGLARTIAAEADPARTYRLMEFCGGHTHAIYRYGVQDLMPANVRFVHGPGCPVCVLPMSRIDQAIAMAVEHGVTLCTYGDLMRVPASERNSLLKAKAGGADIRMIYSTQDALAIARKAPERQVVLFAIGFETTTPPTAVAIKSARAEGLENFSVFCNHVLTPPALATILASAGKGVVQLDGILGPSHVSTVIGSRPYEFVPEAFGKPVVIAGFEPLDVMQSALMLIRQINAGQASVENQYTRAVTRDGNPKAQALMAEVFSPRDRFEWRGLGFLPASALRIADAYADLDAEQRFPVAPSTGREIKGCECPSVLRGVMEPTDCKLFGTVCTPENPMGACMVSSEGACAAYWSYGRFRAPATQSAVGADVGSSVAATVAAPANLPTASAPTRRDSAVSA